MASGLVPKITETFFILFAQLRNSGNQEFKVYRPVPPAASAACPRPSFESLLNRGELRILLAIMGYKSEQESVGFMIAMLNVLDKV